MKYLSATIVFLFLSISLNAQETCSSSCKTEIDRYLTILKAKHQEFLEEKEKHDFNVTAISLELNKSIESLEKKSEDSVCIKTFIQMMKVPYENFSNYKLKKEAGIDEK